MRLSRRALLGIGIGAGLGVAGPGARYGLAAGRGSDEITPITISASPVPSFAPREPERRGFGALFYRSGLVLTCNDPGFGGLSGLWRAPDGRGLVALTDNAQWLTASLDFGDSRLAGVRGAELAPILGADGRSLRHTRAFDTESLAIADGQAYIGIERVHEVRRFDWSKDGVRARGAALPMPAEAGSLPSNGSLEAVAVAPPSHPLAGSVIAIAEEARSGPDAPTLGFVLTGSRRFSFEVTRRDGFAITDMAFLPSGEALLLERRYRVLTGVACRIRRIARDAFRPDIPLDGPTILDVDGACEIDNMEGIALHADPASGETVVTLVSDDNFSPVQRTLLLEFALRDG